MLEYKSIYIIRALDAVIKYLYKKHMFLYV